MSNIWKVIDAERTLPDGQRYQVQAYIDQETLARLVGAAAPVAAGNPDGITLGEGAIVVKATKRRSLAKKQSQALRDQIAQNFGPPSAPPS
jgi:hypothetical protein